MQGLAKRAHVSLAEGLLKLEKVIPSDVDELSDPRLHSLGLHHRNATQDEKLPEPYLYRVQAGTYKFFHFPNASFPVEFDVYADRLQVP